MMTIWEFVARHEPCNEFIEWAQERQSMEEIWDTACDEWLLWIARCAGVLDCQTMRSHAIWAARQVWHLLGDAHQYVIDVTEAYLRGDATLECLHVAIAAAATEEDALRMIEPSDAWAARSARAAALAAVRAVSRDDDEMIALAMSGAGDWAVRAARTVGQEARQKWAAHIRAQNPFR